MDPAQFFQTYVVPGSLFTIMVGLGLNLTVQDILRIFIMPKAVVTGLIGQLILLPALAFALALSLNLSPIIAIGLIILAACPGGVTSNAYVFASRGDIALSVTLTSIASLFTVFTMPFLTWLALTTFSEAGTMITIPVSDMMISLARLTVLPIVIGMTVRYWRPDFADRIREPVRRLAFILLMVVIIGNTWFSIDTILRYFVQAGLMAIVLNLSCMLMGYGLARLTRLNGPQTISITYEVGLQNLSLALTLANSILMMPDYAIFAIIYGFLMKFSALSFMAWAKKRGMAADVTPATEENGSTPLGQNN